MTEQEIDRAIQYVVATTSYGRDTVATVVRTCLTELASLATTSRHTYERAALMEYVCQWTIRRTGQPEPLVREILGCAGRWLDQVATETASGRRPETGGAGGVAEADDEDDESASGSA